MKPKTKKASKSKISVDHLAELSHLTLSKKEAKTLPLQFGETIKSIKTLNSLNTKNTQPTHHTTGLENVFREDKIEPQRTLSQSQALSNAKSTHKGYFVVKAVIDNE